MAGGCVECGAKHLNDNEVEDLIRLLAQLPSGPAAELVHLGEEDRKKLSELISRLEDLF